jgi:YD repeat-containing protein
MPFEYSPFQIGGLDKVRGDETDPVFTAWLATVESSTITYDGDYIQTIVKGAVTYTMTFTAGVLTSMTDGVTTWTFAYDGTGRLLTTTV